MDEGGTADIFLLEDFRLDRRAGALFLRDDKGAAVPADQSSAQPSSGSMPRGERSPASTRT